MDASLLGTLHWYEYPMVTDIGVIEAYSKLLILNSDFLTISCCYILQLICNYKNRTEDKNKFKTKNIQET